MTQIETRLPEQRISLTLQRADHRPDATAFDQPVSVTGIPLPARSAHERIELPRTTHRDWRPSWLILHGPTCVRRSIARAISRLAAGFGRVAMGTQ